MWGRLLARAAPILCLVVAGATACTPPDETGDAPPTAPNVLLILIDDLGGALGAFGNEQVRTPHIDELAAGGVRFERAYAQATICNPSRASLLTGLRPDTTGVHRNQDDLRETLPDAVTLPELFRRHGYLTVALGKVSHRFRRHEHVDAWDVARHGETTERGGQGEGRNLTGGRVTWCRWLAAEGGDEDQPDGQVARWAVEFLSGGPERPFFLALGFQKPHDPWIVPAAYFEAYDLDSLELHRDPPDASEMPPGALGGPWRDGFDAFTDVERRELLRAYYASVTFVDAQIGKVLRALRDAGLDESTVVVLASDHGLHLGERGWWHKNSLFEVSARVPLIVDAPAIGAAGRRSTRLVELVDIYPTLAELAGIEPPGGLEGRSLVPLLDDPELPWKEAAFTQIYRKFGFGRSVRTPRWRYTEWDDESGSRELYDHDADAGEFVNLAHDPQHADVVERLRALLHRGRRGATP